MEERKCCGSGYDCLGRLNSSKPKKSASLEGDGMFPNQPSESESDEALQKMTYDIDTKTKEGRETWSRHLDFLLSCIGFAVGLGNIWRFPYLCYKNGGGAFLIAYVICFFCGGLPILFLEISLGQFMSQGSLGAWKICPLFQGIGISTTVIVFLMNIYYIVILAWAISFWGHGFRSVLPWSHCNNPWNTERCVEGYIDTGNGSDCGKAYCSAAVSNLTLRNIIPTDPVTEFWERQMLQISDGVDQPNGIVWHLAVSLLIAWVLVYFCVWKGVKSTGKVVYFTATFPYVVLTILLIRGVTLDGAADGLAFYLKPDFTKLGNSEVWIDAGTQIFFSFAIALGAMTALGSYNKFDNNCYRDTFIIAGVNSFTSLYAGLVVFSVLGFIAKHQGPNVKIEHVAESGPGLAFIAYPTATTAMPVAPLWSALFFFTVLLLGLDSQFVAVESFSTVIMDFFPSLRKRWRRETMMAGYCVVSYLLGLTMVTRGGMYVFQLFDYYSASGMALLWVCFFECIAVSWVYGGGKYYDNLELMLGFRINIMMRVCWTVVTPLIVSFIFVFMWVQFKPLRYNNTYEYPIWAQALGMCMAFASMICIPLYMVIKLAITPGTLQERWTKTTTPILQPHQIPPHWSSSDEDQCFRNIGEEAN